MAWTDQSATRRALFASLTLSFFLFGFWSMFNFLAAEDAVVLFNRTNHLSGPVFVYYAGYISAFPQLIAHIASALPPILQALVYGCVALAIWCLTIVYIVRVTGNGYVALLLTALCGVAFAGPIYNLTTSFWTGLVLGGLIGLAALLEDRPLRNFELLLLIPGAFGSPLGLCLLPLFLSLYLRFRDWRSLVAVAFSVASYALLADHSGARADEGSLVLQFVSNVSRIAVDPKSQLLNTSSPGNFAMGVVGLASLILLVGHAVYLLAIRSKTAFPVLAFLAYTLATFFVCLAASEIPLQGRYWFPLIVACAVSFAMLTSSIAPRLLAVPSLLSVIAVLVVSVVRFFDWGGPPVSEVRALWHGHSVNSVITRERHNDGGRWAIGFGNYGLNPNDCVNGREHKYSQAEYGFRTYCGH